MGRIFIDPKSKKGRSLTQAKGTGGQQIQSAYYSGIQTTKDAQDDWNKQVELRKQLKKQRKQS